MKLPSITAVRWLTATGAMATAALSLGCANVPVYEPTADRVAAAIERTRCGPGFDEALLAPVLSGSAVEGWEPLYWTISSHGDPGKRLAGASFTVHPLQGYSAERLGRSLECHSARRVLGLLPPAGSLRDPFWLPGRTVDIDVEPSGNEFAVFVYSDDVDDAGAIVARARAFRD
jgi:hypothetical protein